MSDNRRRRHNSNNRSRANGGENGRNGTQHKNGGSNAKMNSKANGKPPDIQRTVSHDRVRKIVQEEGRTARNLIAWSVPLEDGGDKPKSASPQPNQSKPRPSKQGKSPVRDETPPRRGSRGHDDTSSNVSGSRPSSVNSVGGKRSDLRARYWAFLFDNLQRAVDEIYQTCEADESEVECKEVIMMLEQCTRDFKSLIERVNLMKAYENAKEGHRPTSLAWEIRKTSPGKAYLADKDRCTPSPTISRSLTFMQGQTTSSSPLPPPPQACASTQTPPIGTSLEGNSWADKVKGAPPPRVIKEATPPDGALKPAPTKPTPEEEDADGWETVQRGGRSKIRSSPTQRNGPSKFKAPASSRNKSNQKSENSHNRNRTGQSKSEPKPNRNIASNQTNRSSQKQNNGQGKMQRALSYSDVASSPKTDVQPNRMRAGSRDSEKENIPSNSNSAFNLNGPTNVNVVPPVIQRSISSDAVMSSNRGRGSSHSNSCDISVSKTTSRDSLAEPRVVSEEEFDNRDLNTAEDGGFSEEDLPIMDGSDTERDDIKKTSDELEDDALTSELENALVSALNEEDSLSHQLEEVQEQALQSAIKEEQDYLKEIEKEENTQYLENETDSELGPMQRIHWPEDENTGSSFGSSQRTWDWESMSAEAEHRSSMSWGDIVEDEEVEARIPGRGVHMHEKLSSPSRKRSLTESRKRHEEKQAKARELREKYQHEKAERLKELSKKVEEVRAWKEELLNQKRVSVESKLQRAEEKRQIQLKMKVRKAHEEETKANEIAFINSLEAQNKRHDILSKHQEVEGRLHDIQETRQRRHEEKAAKEAAVEERRKALEAERVARLQEMQEKRKQRDAKIEQQLIEKEKERLESARQKERERDERIAALNAQQQAHIEELRTKIQQKQDETTKRHHEKLEQIREKAFEMSVLKHSTEDHNDAPRMVPYEKMKVCTICNVMIPSEVYLLSHLRGKKHQQSLQANNGGKDLSKSEIETFNLKHIQDAPSGCKDPHVASDRERQKALKKRCKKLRQRMMIRGSEYENAISSKQVVVESSNRAKLQKVVKDVNKYLQTQESGPWPQSKVSALDRALGEIGRIMDRKLSADQLTFRLCGGLTTLNRILLVIGDSTESLPAIIPNKSLAHVCNVFRSACKNCYDNCHYMLFSNKVCSLVDMLIHQLNVVIPDSLDIRPASSLGLTSIVTPQHLPHDTLATSLMQLIATILSCLAKNNPSINSSVASAERMSSSGDAFMNRGNDIISYIISVGIIDKLTLYFSNVRSPINEDVQAAEFLQHSMGLLVAMTKLISKRNPNVFDKKKIEDPTQLIATFRVTELVGIVSLLYGMLLHCNAPERGSGVVPPELPQHTLAVTTIGIRMLNFMATLDLNMLQSVMGEEGISLEFRHIASYLTWYCSHHPNEELLHEIILCVGYFTVLNLDNQTILQSGQPPTVLQQLCSLPFSYFSDPRLTGVLFPTLIVCCYNNEQNKTILEQELSCALLANFIEEKLLEAQQATLLPSTTKKAKAQDKDKSRDVETRMTLAARFPTEMWTEAQQYFTAV